MRRSRRWVSLALVAALAGACGTLPDGRRWGQDATLAPGWGRLGRSALRAASSPWTWGPLALAGVLAIDRWDQELSTWAREHQPLFGSTDNAEDWAGRLRAAANDAFVATALLTPSGDEPGRWLLSKAEGLAIGLAAKTITSEATDALKGSLDRTRPNQEDDRSMPSGHSSSAFASATLAARNLDSIAMPGALRETARAGVYAIALGTAWSRVESGAHYPADVLVGAALASFLTRFVHDAFLGLPEPGVPEVTLSVLEGGAALTLSWSL